MPSQRCAKIPCFLCVPSRLNLSILHPTYTILLEESPNKAENWLQKRWREEIDASGEIKHEGSPCSRGCIKIGESAFYDCPALWLIYLPGTVQTLEKDCFAYCPSLTFLTFDSDAQDPRNRGKGLFSF
ncbi:MAG: leucine-rich repeat domain-containing protein [Holosporales bacterium]|nr:leucine-rich repeat domain-containing protein [Holosporales bacterium]